MSNQSLREAVQQALEALEGASGNVNPERGFADELEAEITKAITGLRAALAQPDDKAQPPARIPFAGYDPKFCPGSNPDSSQPPAEQGVELSDYPPLPKPLVRIDQSDDGMWGEIQEHAWNSDYTLKVDDPLFSVDQMRAYVDADRAARGGAA